MSKFLKFLDVSFLFPHGYHFNNKINKNLKDSLTKVKYDNKIDLACKIIDRKKKTKDERLVEFLKKISHPHIVSIHSMFQNGSLVFIFMQWVDENLLNFIRKNGAIEESRARKWLFQILMALRYLHDLHIAHCNLSCEAIMLSRDGNVKISNLSYLTQSYDDKNVKLIKSSIPMFYQAPEVNSSTPCIPCKTDIFSLGVILFMMLNNKVPFNPTNVHELVDDQNNRRYHTRNSILHKMSIDAQVAIEILLEPDANLRWSADKLLSHLKWLNNKN